MKLNITPGPWSARRPEDSNGYSYVDGKDSELGRTATCYDGDIYPDNAAAIVTAVNNTYHKGINPEAVPEMLEFLAAIARHPKNDTLADFLIDDAKKLIQKSIL